LGDSQGVDRTNERALRARSFKPPILGFRRGVLSEWYRHTGVGVGAIEEEVKKRLEGGGEGAGR
jgi:hypothetical protein